MDERGRAADARAELLPQEERHRQRRSEQEAAQRRPLRRLPRSHEPSARAGPRHESERRLGIVRRIGEVGRGVVTAVRAKPGLRFAPRRGALTGGERDGAELVAAPGEVLGIRAGWASCSGDAPCGGAESYPAFDPQARALGTRRESMRVSWLATRGHFADTRSGRGETDQALDVTTSWTAPEGATTSVALWFVVRDSRGGTGFRSLKVRVQ